jgi:hypothetical protein
MLSAESSVRHLDWSVVIDYDVASSIMVEASSGRFILSGSQNHRQPLYVAWHGVGTAQVSDKFLVIRTEAIYCSYSRNEWRRYQF